MHLMRMSGLLVAMTLASGCAAKKAPPPPAPTAANENTLERVRESLKRVDPQSQVGLVIAVLPDERLVAVGEVPVRAFRVGEMIMFIDSDQNPLASGTITNITGDALHVRYDEPADNQRAPVIGDLGVKIK